MKRMIIEGMPRPSAIEAHRSGGLGYQALTLQADGTTVVTTYRLEVVEHTPCGWRHPTWPDEAAGRLQAHLRTCEMRSAPEAEQ